MKCPGFRVLIDYLDSRLGPALSEEVRAHLASQCGPCKADRVWYETVKRIAASDDSVEPPQWVLKRAFRIFQMRRSQKGVLARAGSLVASLVFDSFARPEMAGARSADISDRQMLYRAEGLGIDLHITSAENARACLRGQILGEGEFTFDSVKQLSVTLLRHGRALKSGTSVDRARETN